MDTGLAETRQNNWQRLFRRLLVRSGAIRFYKRNSPHIEENERWGLRERNREALKKAEDEEEVS
jgi:hypothetical protein